MDFGSIPLLQAMAKRMAWLNQRQSVLAENVANANTPGYLAQDLKPVDFQGLLGNANRRLQLTQTSAGQLPGTRPGGDYAPQMDPSSEKTLSGNAVNLESEMLKVSDTTSNYQLVTDLYREHIGMLKTALGKGG